MTDIPNTLPVHAHGLHIDDLFHEAKNWLDGSGVSSAADAEGVAKLLDAVRQARKAADEQRKVEKAPHDAAAKAVQEAWVPLLAKCDLVAATCKEALNPWQRKLDDEQRAIAEAANAEAERLRLVALEAAQGAAQTGDLSAREIADDALKAAETARKVASKADNAKPQVAGGSRAIGLRTSWIAELADARAALTHYMKVDGDELKAWILAKAQRDVNNGAREIPGILVRSERNAA